jgi:hypothetical protein
VKTLPPLSTRTSPGPAFRYLYKGGFIKGSREGRGEVHFYVPGAPAGTKIFAQGTFSGGEMVNGDIRYAPGDFQQRNFYRGPTRGIEPPMPHGPQGRLDYVSGDFYVGSFVSLAASSTLPRPLASCVLHLGSFMVTPMTHWLLHLFRKTAFLTARAPRPSAPALCTQAEWRRESFPARDGSFSDRLRHTTSSPEGAVARCR